MSNLFENIGKAAATLDWNVEALLSTLHQIDGSTSDDHAVAVKAFLEGEAA